FPLTLAKLSDYYQHSFRPEGPSPPRGMENRGLPSPALIKIASGWARLHAFSWPKNQCVQIPQSTYPSQHSPPGKQLPRHVRLSKVLLLPWAARSRFETRFSE